MLLVFACNLSAAFALPDSAAHASDLFSKKSLFEDDDLFDDKEVKQAEAEQATRAKIEAAEQIREVLPAQPRGQDLHRNRRGLGHRLEGGQHHPDEGHDHERRDDDEQDMNDGAIGRRTHDRVAHS